jgi:hypothetical protein
VNAQRRFVEVGLTTNNYHYDIDEEIFQTGGRQIYDYLESLERDLMTRSTPVWKT